MDKNVKAIHIALSSAEGLKKLLSISQEQAINLRLSIRWIYPSFDESYLIVNFYSGTPLELIKILPSVIEEISIKKLIGGNPLKN